MNGLLAVSEVQPWVGTLCTALAIVFMFAMPLFMLWLTKKVKFLNTIGAIALCYALGFVISLIPIPYDRSLTELIASILVAVAIPLILFSFDILSVRKLAKKSVIAFALVIVSVVVVSCSAYFIAGAAGMENTGALAGMTAGLYTGGTPNLISVGNALLPFDIRSDVITAASTADFFVGGVYFLLILTIIRPLYKKFLGDKKPQPLVNAEGEVEPLPEAPGEYDYKSIPRDKKSIGKLIGVIGMAIGCLGVGAGLEVLINGNLDGSLYIMVAVSVLGIAFSFIRPVRRVKGSYQVGQYLILIFSLGLAMSIDLNQLAATILPTLLFFTCVQVATILLHLLLCKLFRIDGGTALITSTAGIYGPPFIAPVANAYGDRELIAPGIICGTLGLVIGNFLGLGIGTLLALF